MLIGKEVESKSFKLKTLSMIELILSNDMINWRFYSIVFSIGL